MNIADKTILITGAGRGIGRALLDEALRRGAKRVYAGTRGPLRHADARVRAVKLDVTSAEDIQRAVASIDSLDVLVNNAGIAPYDDLSNPDVLERPPNPWHAGFSMDSRGARRTSSPIRHPSRSRMVGGTVQPRRLSGSLRPLFPPARPEPTSKSKPTKPLFPPPGANHDGLVTPCLAAGLHSLSHPRRAVGGREGSRRGALQVTRSTS